MSGFDYSIQEFLREFKQTKDSHWKQTSRILNEANMSPYPSSGLAQHGAAGSTPFSSSASSSSPVVPHDAYLHMLEEKFTQLDFRVNSLEANNWHKTNGCVNNDEETIRMLRLLTKAETLLLSLTNENRALREQILQRNISGNGTQGVTTTLPNQKSNTGAPKFIVDSVKRSQSAPSKQHAYLPRFVVQARETTQEPPIKDNSNSNRDTLQVISEAALVPEGENAKPSTTQTPESSIPTSVQSSSPPQTSQFRKARVTIRDTIGRAPSNDVTPSSNTLSITSPIPTVANTAITKIPGPPKMTVLYPPGYDPQRRRYSVSSESFNPEQFVDVKQKIIPKTEAAKERIRSIVQGNVLFKHLDDEQLNEVVDAMEEISLEPHTVVIKQGAFVDENHMFVVDEGELEVLYGDEVVATLSNGSAFGEIALMYGCPRTATIKTRIPCNLWVLDRNSFRRILMEESIRRRKLYESVLSKVPIFKSLLPYERAKIADALESVAFQDSEVIIVEGSTNTDKFYIIERGEVVCTKASKTGDFQVESCRLKAGDFFGELALLTNEPRKATVKAVGVMKCLTIGKEHFHQVMGPCEQLLRDNIANYKSYEELASGITQRMHVIPPVIDDTSETVKLDDLPVGREDIIKYIIQNENSFVFNLSQTEGYRQALEEHKEQIHISQQQIQAIFSNIHEISHVHSNLNKVLQEIKDEEDPELGELFSNHVPALTVHEKFVQSFPASLRTLKECSAHTSFTDFLMACHKEAGESLDTLLVLIYQRISHILALFKHLLEATEMTHPDKNGLAIAVRKLEALKATLTNIKHAADS